MFSKSCEYAIRAMTFIAQKSKNDVRVSIKTIAQETDAPTHFMAKIMQDLSQKKLVNSLKGPNGGFYIDEFRRNVSIATIIKAIDGDDVFEHCVLGLKACGENNPCPIHSEYKIIKKNIIDMVEHNTIDSFSEKIDTRRFFLKN